MESEKVKEIKDRLQEQIDYGCKKNGIAVPLVSVELLNTTLIIIEDLEKANKTKYDAMVTLFKGQEFYKKRNEILKDENERLLGVTKEKIHDIGEMGYKHSIETKKLKDDNLEIKNAKDRLLEENKTLVWLNQNMCKENQKLKARISELEKENTKWIKEVEDRKAEVLHLQEYGKKLIREIELKQFAERLKEKGKSTYDFFQCPTKENRVISISDIDETLKELVWKTTL